MGRTIAKDKARQGKTGVGVRYVLGSSLLLAIVALALVGYLSR